MATLKDLQDAPSKPSIHRVRYTDPEWELLAQAMIAEIMSSPQNIGLSIVQLANQSQKNQTKILLGEDYSPDGHVSWDARNFTAVVQLSQAIKYMHGIICSMKETCDLFKMSSDENKSQVQQIGELEAEIERLKKKEPSFEDFRPEDIVAEAAFIQAQQAERLEKSAAGLRTEMSKIAEMISESKKEATTEIKTVLDSAVKSLEHSIRNAAEKTLVPPVLTSVNGRGSHHKKVLAKR